MTVPEDWTVLPDHDVVWARDSNGVVHFWYKMPNSEGYAGCLVPRSSIQQFTVLQESVTCLACLATQGDATEGHADYLLRRLYASLRKSQELVEEYRGNPEAPDQRLEFGTEWPCLPQHHFIGSGEGCERCGFIRETRQEGSPIHFPDTAQ